MSQLPAERARRRDFLLMPLIGILTTAVIFVSAELLARTHFYESPDGLGACLDDSDPLKGVRGRPNTVCHEKSLESDNIEYRLDSRGYRSNGEQTFKDSGTYRIVLIGSSVAMGERVQINDSPAAALSRQLSVLTARKIGVDNQGMAWGFARSASLRFADAIAAQPNLILWVVTPLDIARSEQIMPRKVVMPPPAKGIDSFKRKLLQYIRGYVGDIVIGVALRHFLYEFQSEDQFVRASLQDKSSDDESGFLLIDQGPAWKKNWTDFSGHARDMIAQSRAAGIPMAVAFAPNRSEAAMISSGKWPTGYDPYQVDREVQRLVEADGAIFMELLQDYRAVPASEHFYLPLDGHPTIAGYAFLADAISRQLTNGKIPALAGRSTAMQP